MGQRTQPWGRFPRPPLHSKTRSFPTLRCKQRNMQYRQDSPPPEKVTTAADVRPDLMSTGVTVMKNNMEYMNSSSVRQIYRIKDRQGYLLNHAIDSRRWRS